MGKLSRLIRLASDALDTNGASGSRRSGEDGRGATDWSGMIRGAVDSVRGAGAPSESRGAPAPSTPPPAPQRAARPRPASASGGPYSPPPAPGGVGASAVDPRDRAAIARYDYLMQTADPHRIEQIHREAFASLTPQQRELLAARMRQELPAGERPRSASADDLARAAGRAEAMRPGRMRGLLSRTRGVGGGAALAAGGAAFGLLGVVAGGAVVSAVAAPLLDQAASLGVDFGALAEGLDVEALASGVDVEALTGGAGELLGSAGEAVSGLGETATGWGERLGDLGVPGIGDLFGR